MKLSYEQLEKILDDAERECAREKQENAKLKEENDKLRNLAARMLRTIKWNDRISDSMYWPSLSYERELREFGVETENE